METLNWRKSSRSGANGEQCVEVAVSETHD
jgi:hypothetical protein